MSEQSLSSQIFTRKMLICVFTGFSSGLPLFVLSQMLPVWLTDKGLSVELIGALTGVMVPYGLKRSEERRVGKEGRSRGWRGC